MLTPHHVDIQRGLRVAELRVHDATQIPEGYVPLGHRALADRIGRDPRTARRYIERAAAMQHREDILRVVLLPVPIGSGAVRPALHVLWPVGPSNSGPAAHAAAA
jgi:hypothetical protein